jgi:hypothetical protein
MPRWHSLESADDERSLPSMLTSHSLTPPSAFSSDVLGQMIAGRQKKMTIVVTGMLSESIRTGS